ncbi:3'-5' exonuclease [Sediminitomix flava]|uniref:DNA polymerase-3 subunit epsilon n=1 Tax=Sediminitomix flava TaxID=379075 RepID=A0A315ZAC4_SEDFL|nr:3'-5' exonuclease [Sediminitomix flava]PWJ42536.1 DNA polymerase-3 subunit epsilon [Sediminitomix flava]
MNFTAIDFETANAQRNSVCAVGITRVENGNITDSFSQLIRPEPCKFDLINITVHGIKPEMVAEAPTFAEYWETMLPYLNNQLLIAHNAPFDMSVLRASMKQYGIVSPDMSYACTVRLAKFSYPTLINHKLNTLAHHLEIPLNHHDAGSDAYACAVLALRMAEKRGVDNLQKLVAKEGMYLGKIFSNGYTPFSNRPQKPKFDNTLF